MNDLLAHLPYCGTPPVPTEIWARWNFDPILICALLVLVAWGALRMGLIGANLSSSGQSPSVAQRAAYFSGWPALTIGLTSPICALSVSLFSARVTQHMWLIVVAAPLLALSMLDSQRAQQRSRSVPPFTAAGLFAVALWLWHWPALYAHTFTSDVTYWAMHVSMISAAVLLWRSLLEPAEEHALARVVTGFITLTHMGVLGALITFAPRALYTPHFLTAPAWNLSALEDQQLGGLIMWIPASAVFLVAALLTAYGVVREDDRPAAGVHFNG